MLKVAIVAIFIVAAVWFVSSANWVTAGNPDGAFIPPSKGPGEYGWSGIMRGAAVVFFAYIGFDAVSTAAQEAKNPQRSMMIGILGSLVICTILYVLVGSSSPASFRTTSSTSWIPWPSPSTPSAQVASSDHQDGAILSVILVSLLGQARILYSMAKDKLLPPSFADVHRGSARLTSPPRSPGRSSPSSRVCCRSADRSS